MKSKRNNILDNIVKIRKNKGFNQDYIAEKLGMKQSGYGLVERGDRRLQYEVLLQIADIFEMDVIDVITYPDTYCLKQVIHEQLTKVLVELDISADEFIKMGLKDKVIQVLKN
ncbi:MAG: helix-turn-helix domain-containing protein [Prevotellaceae bacterium]|jgi:transcriptional regulator with XRE-family HTH domain|nr:helix-turn-helix domain-containing protein [Prevotellaceae bacterium]